MCDVSSELLTVFYYERKLNCSFPGLVEVYKGEAEAGSPHFLCGAELRPLDEVIL